MSNYSKATDFATKDSLPSGDPGKVVKGTEIDAEFVAIATMSATKQDTLPTTDANPIAFAAGDSTKKLAFSLAGITTGTTRTWTIPDASGTVQLQGQIGSFTTVAIDQISLDRANLDVILVRDAANTLAQRNGVTGQISRTYNTFTDAANYERLEIGWTTNIAQIFTSQAGTGVARELRLGTSGVNVINFFTNNANRWQISSSGHVLSASDNALDIGAVGANRVRTGYFGTSLVSPILDSNTGSLVLKGAGTTALTLTGANTVLAGSLAWGTGAATFGQLLKRKTADETVTSSTTLQDDDHLVLAVAANEEWLVNYYISVSDALSTHGLKINFTVPTGAPAASELFAFLIGDASASVAKRGTVNSTYTWTAASLGTNAFGTLMISIYFVNGANAGNVTLQWAQETSNVAALRFRRGSWMNAIRMA